MSMDTSGTDMAKAAPRTAARVVLIAHTEGGDVQNAWDVLVSAFGEEVAADLIDVQQRRDIQFKDVDVANLIADLRTTRVVDTKRVGRTGVVWHSTTASGVPGDLGGSVGNAHYPA